MNKLNFSMDMTLMVVILLHALPTHGMENYEQSVEQIEESNNSGYSLTLFPDEILSAIFSYAFSVDVNNIKSTKTYSLLVDQYYLDSTYIIPSSPFYDKVEYGHVVRICTPLEKSIKHCMKLSKMCKKFNAVLTPEIIGKFQEKYNLETKNILVNLLLCHKHAKYNLPVLILVHAGANDEKLIFHAIEENKIPLIKALLKCKVDPNKKCTELGKYNGNQPAFFYANTKEIAEILINGGAQINRASSSTRPNVLWTIVYDQMLPELIQVYLDYGIDACIQESYSGVCILHVLGQVWPDENFPNRLFEQAQILVKAIPNMINTRDRHGNTPLDYVQMSVRNKEKPVFKKIAQLFRDHGALTAKELEQQPK